MVEQWNRYGGTHMIMEQRNSDSGTVQQRWWNSATEMVEQWNNDGGTVEQ